MLPIGIRNRSRARSAFTLIELMIVIVIIGILATIVFASMSGLTKESRKVSTEEAVFQVRQGVSIYQMQTGRIPNLIASWDPLTRQTTVAGKTVGPFLTGPPRNLIVNGNPSCITDGNAPTLSTTVCSFLYDYNGGNGSGRFIASFDP
jgi:prepilin-type N-terminal cleavage/methylation domain-containing protein